MNVNYSNTSSKSQRKRILNYLRSKPLTTLASGQGKHRIASSVLQVGGVNHE